MADGGQAKPSSGEIDAPARVLAWLRADPEDRDTLPAPPPDWGPDV
jgi:hypothetical protein